MALVEEAGGDAARDLDGHIKAVEEAARDWGVHADALGGGSCRRCSQRSRRAGG